MIRCAVLGYGFIGSVHAATIQKIKNAQLVGIVEQDRKKWENATKGNIEINGMQPVDVPFFASIEELIDNKNVDCISICLPTFLHREYTEVAMEKGLHVICEKPMALTQKDCTAMITAAKIYDRQLFIAQCIRFWPEYQELKKIYDSGELGRPVSLLFRRLSGMPTWGGPNSWFMDEKKSGGCLFDLHVHDLDFIQYLLGKPLSVFSQTHKAATDINSSVFTQYIYDNTFSCCAEGSWLYFSGFKMTFSCVFENGQIEYDSSVEPNLKLWRKGQEQPEVLSVEKSDGYLNEYEYFLSCLNEKKKPKLVMPESAALSIRIALAEKKSIREKKIIDI